VRESCDDHHGHACWTTLACMMDNMVDSWTSIRRLFTQGSLSKVPGNWLQANRFPTLFAHAGSMWGVSGVVPDMC